MITVGFPITLIENLACQNCLGELVVKPKVEQVIDGVVTCITCGSAWKICGGILDLLDRVTLDMVRESEILSRDNEAKRYDRRLASRHEKEVVSTLRAIGDVTGKTTIEYGAGTGRLTVEYAKNAKSVLACDFSLSSLKILGEKIGPERNVGLVCADATSIRTKPGAFDLAIATQFYEHLPSQELRDSFLLHCREALALDGRFVSTTYHYDLRRILRRLPQEGMHSGEIFFHYYTPRELRADIGKFFTIVDIHPIDITLPLEARFAVPPRFGGLISRFFERIPFFNRLGHLLLVSAEARAPATILPPK